MYGGLEREDELPGGKNTYSYKAVCKFNFFFNGGNQSTCMYSFPKFQKSIPNLQDISNIVGKYEFCESFSSHQCVLGLYISVFLFYLCETGKYLCKSHQYYNSGHSSLFFCFVIAIKNIFVFSILIYCTFSSKIAISVYIFCLSSIFCGNT